MQLSNYIKNFFPLGWQNVSRYLGNFVPIFFTVLTLCVLHRITVVRTYYWESIRPIYNPKNRIEGAQLVWESHSESLLLGISSDVLFSLLIAFFLSLAFVRNSLLFAVLSVLTIFFAANYEHIKYNFSHINLATVGNAASLTFLNGQMTPELGKIFVLLGVVVIATWILMNLKILRQLGAVFVAPLVAFAFFLPIKFNHVEPAWMQTHPLLPSTSAKIEGTDMKSFPETISNTTTNDLQDLAYHNILLIYLEGLSEKSLELGEMVNLKRLSESNISFSRYFGNQLITSNGLYSTLTGDFPNYNSKSAKWDNLDAESYIARHAVPALLRDAGYKTAFLQSADLSFMNKATILQYLGFSEVRGLNSWNHSYSSNGWGIDDRALFEHTLEYIDAQAPERPWFVSVLTTGTHSPYNVPPEFISNKQADRYKALAYLDIAIGELMRGLQNRDLLKDTVVIFTSDESRERSFESPVKDELLLHWLPLVVIHPSNTRKNFGFFVSSEQFPDLIAAIAGRIEIAKLKDLERAGRPLLLGNPYSNRFFWFDPTEQEMLLCAMPSFECAVFEKVNDPVTMKPRRPDRVAHFPDLKRLVSELERVE